MKVQMTARRKLRERERTRVLFLIPGDLPYGGTERLALNLSHELARRQWSTRTVFPELSNSDAMLAWCRDEGVTAEVTPVLLRWGASHSWRNVFELRRFVQECKPDIVNLHYGGYWASFKDVLAVRLAGQHRCIITINHTSSWNNRGKADFRKRTMTRLSALLAHTVVAISDATRDTLMRASIPAYKISVIPCGLRAPKDPPVRADARRRLKLPADAFVIGSVARLEPHKGLADLVDAIAQMPASSVETVVVIAGDGDERPALEKRIAARLGDRGILLGRIPDATVSDVYAASDVFALPSYEEGFGIVYAEAAFYGVPSVGTTVGGVPDVVINGETGLLVQPGDIAALTMALTRLRDDSDLRRRLGEAARIRTLSTFTSEHMADLYEAVFLRGRH